MKIINVLLIMVLVVITLSCSKDNDSSTGPDYGFDENLIGYWNLTAYIDEDGEQDVTGYIEISSNQSLVGEMDDNDERAHFSGNVATYDNKILVDIEESDVLWIEEGEEEWTYDIQGSTLQLSGGTINGESTELTYLKDSNEYGSLEGIVTMADRNEPVYNAHIEIVSTNFSAYTDIDGTYFINEIPVGSYEVQISYDGCDTFSDNIAIQKDQVTTLNAELEYSTGGTGTITGFVADALEQVPIANANISIEGTSHTTQSNSEGIYLFENISVGTYTVNCSKSGYESMSSTDVQVIADETVYTDFLMLPEGSVNYGYLSGTVTDTQGNPIKNVTVQIEELYNTAVTFEDGSYEMVAIPPGTYTVSFTKPGYETYLESNVQINDGQDTILNVSMEQHSGTGSLVVYAETPLGIPVSGVLIEILDTQYSGTTSTLGTLTIQNIPTGSYTVRASKSGYTTHEFENTEILSGIPRILDIIME